MAGLIRLPTLKLIANLIFCIGVDGAPCLLSQCERETKQAWLLVLVGGVTPTASFTPLCWVEPQD